MYFCCSLRDPRVQLLNVRGLSSEFSKLIQSSNLSSCSAVGRCLCLCAGEFSPRIFLSQRKGSPLLRTLAQCQQVRLLALRSFHFLPLACFLNFLSGNSKLVVFYDECPWSDVYVLRISLSKCLHFLCSVRSACRWGSLSFISQTALLRSCSFRICLLYAFVDLDHSLWQESFVSAWEVYQHGRFVH